jgi:hypothetical protein
MIRSLEIFIYESPATVIVKNIFRYTTLQSIIVLVFYCFGVLVEVNFTMLKNILLQDF